VCEPLTVPSRRAADDPEAGAIVIAALSYFATHPKTMDRFFALTGLDPASLKDAASAPGFLAGVLDFVIEDARVLAAVAEAQETTPEAIVAARARLDRPRGDPAGGGGGAGGDDGWPPRVADDWA
jgi:hypothetical protein